jgi:hypothetical protein
VIKVDRYDAGIDTEINRLADGPTSADLLEFEIVLEDQFRATQAAVHVITRSLKGSGRSSFKMDENSWEGEITYGGPSPGFLHNPVDYAEYERERDGNHDFLAPAETLSAGYIKAMDEFLRG